MKHSVALGALSSIAAAAIVAGLLIDSRSFASNALAELAGLAVGAVVAVIVADHLIEQRRRTRWERVASTTIASIMDRLGSIQSNVIEFGVFPGDDDGALLMERDVSRALDLIAQAISARQVEVARSADQDFLSVQRLHDAVRQDIHFVRDMLTPRALELATDTGLVELLLSVETAERVWAEGERLVVDDWGYPEQYVWSHAFDFFSAAALLAEHLARFNPPNHLLEAIQRADPSTPSP